MGNTRVSDREYIEARIAVQPNGCWHWTGALSPRGWGRATRGRDYAVPAHRFVWMTLGRDFDAALVFDHLCHNSDVTCAGGPSCMHRRCVNPDHLEQVTQAENVRRGNTLPAQNLRKKQCPRGHEYDHADARGWRKCSICMNTAGWRRRRAEGKWQMHGPVCKRGHEWTEETTIITRTGHRRCRICARDGARRRKERKA